MGKVFYIRYMFKAIDDYVSGCIALTQEELNFFHSVLQVKQFKKKTFLLRAGEICEYESYINKGCVKVFYIDENGSEVILHFAIENWWIGDITSFTQRTASNLYMEVLEDSELFMINYADKEKLYEKVPKFERIFRLMIQRTHTSLMNRLISTMSKPAEERYLDFISRYPSIPQRVPQHLIASYLGISPEFLSKIKAKIARS